MFKCIFSSAEDFVSGAASEATAQEAKVHDCDYYRDVVDVSCSGYN